MADATYPTLVVHRDHTDPEDPFITTFGPDGNAIDTLTGRESAVKDAVWAAIYETGINNVDFITNAEGEQSAGEEPDEAPPPFGLPDMALQMDRFVRALTALEFQTSAMMNTAGRSIGVSDTLVHWIAEEGPACDELLAAGEPEEAYRRLRRAILALADITVSHAATTSEAAAQSIECVTYNLMSPEDGDAGAEADRILAAYEGIRQHTLDTSMDYVRQAAPLVPDDAPFTIRHVTPDVFFDPDQGDD